MNNFSIFGPFWKGSMDLFLSDERVVSIEILWDHYKALYSMISSVQGLKYWNLYNMSLVESKK